MNAQPITLKSSALLGLLLAVSAFNLSALPNERPTVVTRTLSSVDTCDLGEQLRRSDTPSASCAVKSTTGKLTGVLKIEKVSEPVHDWEEGNGAVKTTQSWKTSLETDCLTGCATGTRVTLANSNFKTLKEAMAAALEQKALFQKEADRQAEEQRKKEELQARQDNCEIDAKGEELKEDKALACKVRRVSKISKREDAAKCYQDEIQPQLQNLITCDSLSGTGSMMSIMPAAMMQQSNQKCAGDRAKAAGLLKQLGSSALNNPYIKQSAVNLAQFGQYATAMDQMDVLARYTNDPNQKQMLQQRMQQLQSSWGGYFAQQGLAINQMRAPMDWDASVLGYNDGLYGNLVNYNSAFNQLATQHQAMLGLGTNTNNNANAMNAARLQRGQVSTQYQNAPAAPISAQQTPFGQAQSAQPMAPSMPQPVGLNANRAGGTPNIIKPALGASVR